MKVKRGVKVVSVLLSANIFFSNMLSTVPLIVYGHELENADASKVMEVERIKENADASRVKEEEKIELSQDASEITGEEDERESQDASEVTSEEDKSESQDASEVTSEEDKSESQDASEVTGEEDKSESQDASKIKYGENNAVMEKNLYRKISDNADNIRITVAGNIPDTAKLSVVRDSISEIAKENMVQESDILESSDVLNARNSKYQMYVYDISILCDGMEYEPYEFGNSVEVTFQVENRDAFSNAELEVFHVKNAEDEVEKIDILDASVDKIVFEADHFSTYIILADTSYEGEVSWNFSYNGKTQYFTAPVTGKYKFELYGAQGENSVYRGGNGGYVSGEIFLEKGQTVKVVAGGQGKSGSLLIGGNGTISRGGGATYIESNDTLLAVAGGGGGGNKWIAGGNGGDTDSGNTNIYLSSENTNMANTAGGGAGYRGGSYGYAVTHTHAGASNSYGGCYTSPVYHSHTSGCYREGSWVNKHYHNNSYTGGQDTCYTCSICGGHDLYGHSLCRELICSSGGAIEYYNISCGKTAGVTIDSAKKSYGGSNYVNKTYCFNSSLVAGKNPGNGMVQLKLSEIDIETVDMKIELEQSQATEKGTEYVSVRYGEPMEQIILPKREGMFFQGYFKERDGKGKQYYHADGTNILKSDFIKNDTLYAYWVNPIIIEKQPVSVHVKAGYQSVMMDIKANYIENIPCELSYQWYYYDNMTEKPKKLENADASKLEIPKGFSVGSYEFFCEITAVSTQNGQKVIKRSNPAVLTVDKGVLSQQCLKLKNQYVIYDEKEHITEVIVNSNEMPEYDLENNLDIYYSTDILTEQNYKEAGRQEPLSYINAGIYPIYIYVTSKDFESFGKKFEMVIDKSAQKVYLNDYSIYYDGTPKRISEAIVYGVDDKIRTDVKISYEYYTDSECKLKTSQNDGALIDGTEPTEVGKYYVKAFVCEDENFYSAVTEKTAILEIKELPQADNSDGDSTDGSGSDKDEDLSGGNDSDKDEDLSGGNDSDKDEDSTDGSGSDKDNDNTSGGNSSGGNVTHIHTYKLIKFVAPTADKKGWALYRCDECGNELTYEYDALGANQDIDISSKADSNIININKSDKNKAKNNTNDIVIIEEEPISLIQTGSNIESSKDLEKAELNDNDNNIDASEVEIENDIVGSDISTENDDKAGKRTLLVPILMFVLLIAFLLLGIIAVTLLYPFILYKKKHCYKIKGELSGDARSFVIDVDMELDSDNKKINREQGTFMFKGFCESQLCRLMVNTLEGKTMAIIQIDFNSNNTKAEILTANNGIIISTKPIKNGIFIDIQ